MDELLTKGVEEEIYTGRYDGEVLGLSHKIAADLPHFRCEPDARNAEFATLPYRSYEKLKCEICCLRCQLLRYLKKHGNYALIPGASLSLGDTSKFIRSDPNNPYHSYIEKTYGATVVTASAHLNLGIEYCEDIIKAYRLIRCEAFAYLALSASSPFLDNAFTGLHSNRWHTFPQTPADIPLFENHAAYVSWAEEQMNRGNMQNIRHVWTSVRPNGIGAPEEIQRLELRICDRMDRVHHLIGLLALFESRVQQVIQNQTPEPLDASSSPDELLTLARKNEEAVSHNSLDAEITDWRTGDTMKASEWIREYIKEIMPIAQNLGITSHLKGIEDILENGNTAQQWIKKHQEGKSIRQIISTSIIDFEKQDIMQPSVQSSL